MRMKPMTRKSFLTIVGGVALTALAACSNSVPSSQVRAEGSTEGSAGSAATLAGGSDEERVSSTAGASGAASAVARRINVSDGTNSVSYELNGTAAASSLYDQLPLSLEVGDYSDNEKAFYPQKLDTTGAVDSNGAVGTLAYFSPWGGVVMYYGHDAGPYQGLYDLGTAVEGAENVQNLQGTITVTKVE